MTALAHIAPLERDDQTTRARTAGKAGPEQTARRFAKELAEKWCRIPGTYALWANNETLGTRHDLTPKQIRTWLKHAETFGHITRYPSARAFKRWLEMEGAPRRGLDPKGPRNMRTKGRVIVLNALLPPESTQGYGPLGLRFDQADDVAQAQAPTPTTTRPTEPKTTTTRPTPTPCPKPAAETDPETLWRQLTTDEQAQRIQAATLAHPEIRWPNMLRQIAVAAHAAQLGVQPTPPPPHSSSKPAISQGNPRPTRHQHHQPPEWKRRKQWAETILETADEIRAAPGPHQRQRLDALAEQLAALLADAAHMCIYRARLRDHAAGRINSADLAAAVEHAIQPGRRDPGKCFSAELRRRSTGQATQPAGDKPRRELQLVYRERKTTADPAPWKVGPAVGNDHPQATEAHRHDSSDPSPQGTCDQWSGRGSNPQPSHCEGHAPQDDSENRDSGYDARDPHEHWNHHNP